MHEEQLQVGPYSIYSQIHPCDNPQGVIVLCHGLGEHIGRYTHLINEFGKLGYAVVGSDHPGHGESSGKRGDITDFELLYTEIDRLIDLSIENFPGLPLFLYGHSLGGNISLGYLLRHPGKFNAGVITSPWIKLPAKVPWLKEQMARLVGFVAPGFTAPNGLDPSGISHDRTVVEAYINDPLVHDKISVRLFNSASENAEYILCHAASLEIPVLLLHGSMDPMTSHHGSTEFAAKAGEIVEYHQYKSMFHELHNEKVANDLIKRVGNWLNSHI